MICCRIRNGLVQKIGAFVFLRDAIEHPTGVPKRTLCEWALRYSQHRVVKSNSYNFTYFLIYYAAK